MKQNILETITGFIVLFIAIAFGTYSYQSKNSDRVGQYKVTAKFDSVEGIIKGSDIQIGGIVVGKVSDLKLDQITYSAILSFVIDDNIKIPSDSRASVSSSGFLGGKYISISPGGDDTYLKNGDQIKYTQSSINLESLIGKFMFSGNGQSNKQEGNNQGQNNVGQGNAAPATP